MIRVLGPANISFDEIRGRFHGRVDSWLAVCEWVDQWPERFGLLRELAYGDGSLWWLARYPLIAEFINLFRDIEVVAAALEESGAGRIELTKATSYWETACAIAARACGVELQVTKASVLPWANLRARVAWAGVLAARSVLGFTRGLGSQLHSRRPAVMALGYSSWRRVNHDGRTRYIDPPYALVLDELRRRNVAQLRLSMPTNSSWQRELTWMLRGDREFVPIEFLWARWISQAPFRRSTVEMQRLQRALVKCGRAIADASFSWREFDVSGPVRAIAQAAFRRRVARGLRHIRFFEHLLARRRPSILLLTHEYSGVAMAATIAARRLRIPVVAIQHGVIWRGHPGYIVPRSQVETLPRPDALCVFGQYERELLMQHGYDSEQVVVTGSPRLDLVVGSAPTLTRSRLTAALNLPADQPLVLFTTSGWHSRVVAERLADQITASNKPFSVIVKLHPIYEVEPEAFAAVAADRNCRHLRVIDEEYDLYDLLRIVDAHVSPNSTVLTEAAVFDLPNILFCTDLFPDTVGYRKRSVAVAAEDFSSLGAALEAAIASPELKAGRKAFVEAQYYRLDGGAAGRIADVVEALAKKADRTEVVGAR